MPIDRSLWKIPFQENRAPDWPCPRCGVGLLRLIEGSFKCAELADSRQITKREDLDPVSINYSYSAMFECNNEACKECVSSCGRGNVIEDYTYDEDGHPDLDYSTVFTPEYFHPSLIILSIPLECPTEVAEEITSSFKLFFCDPAASANHVRKCIENILTDKGVKRFRMSSGKRRFVGLHQRITLYQSGQPDVTERLLAIKWLGNEGSHAGEITRDDVLDAYEILETVIDDLYVGYGKSVKKKVAVINKRKRPLKR